MAVQVSVKNFLRSDGDDRSIYEEKEALASEWCSTRAHLTATGSFQAGTSAQVVNVYLFHKKASLFPPRTGEALCLAPPVNVRVRTVDYGVRDRWKVVFYVLRNYAPIRSLEVCALCNDVLSEFLKGNSRFVCIPTLLIYVPSPIQRLASFQGCGN